MENISLLKEYIGDYSLGMYNPDMSFEEQKELLSDSGKLYDWLMKKENYHANTLIEPTLRWTAEDFSEDKDAIKKLSDGYYLNKEEKERMLGEWCIWALQPSFFSWLGVGDISELKRTDTITLFRTVNVDSIGDIVVDGDDIGACWTSDKSLVESIDGYQEGDCPVYLVADVKVSGINLILSHIYHVGYFEKEVDVFDRGSIDLIGVFDANWDIVDLDDDRELPTYQTKRNEENYSSF